MRYNKEKALVRGKKKDKAFVRIFGGIFVLVGIILFTVCIFIYTSGHTFKAEATPVQAVILAMRGANHESLGTPVVEYTVGGKTYTSTLNLSSSSMHPGKQITVYYRNGNPQEVRYLDDNNWIIGLLMAMAFVFAGISIVAGSSCQAFGYSVYSMLISIARQIVVLIPAAYLLSLAGVLRNVWFAFPIAEVVSLLLSLMFLRITLKKTGMAMPKTK